MKYARVKYRHITFSGSFSIIKVKQQARKDLLSCFSDWLHLSRRPKQVLPNFGQQMKHYGKVTFMSNRNVTFVELFWRITELSPEETREGLLSAAQHRKLPV